MCKDQFSVELILIQIIARIISDFFLGGEGCLTKVLLIFQRFS